MKTNQKILFKFEEIVEKDLDDAIKKEFCLINEIKKMVNENPKSEIFVKNYPPKSVIAKRYDENKEKLVKKIIRQHDFILSSKNKPIFLGFRLEAEVDEDENICFKFYSFPYSIYLPDSSNYDLSENPFLISKHFYKNGKLYEIFNFYVKDEVVKVYFGKNIESISLSKLNSFLKYFSKKQKDDGYNLNQTLKNLEKYLGNFEV